MTTIQTWDHPDRPASLPNETLTLSTVYQRAGVEVKKSGSDNVVPLSLAGADAKWSNQEMHGVDLEWPREKQTAAFLRVNAPYAAVVRNGRYEGLAERAEVERLIIRQLFAQPQQER